MGIEAELGRATIAIRATMEKLDGDLAEARDKTDSAIARITSGAGKALQGLGTVALSGVAAATGAVIGLGAALAKITVDAAPVEGLSQAFSGLAESAGIGTDEMLAALKRGSAGMVSNRDLMLSFNKAASLVSTDFAVQLPDAMQYLGKVSASTGQDMGFMLDSLVKGVGRLSPMILDNLGIQVSLEEATARAAEMYGVEAGALQKDQLQAGMMNVVLEKLAANTASMPDVTETAAAKMARFRATIQDTKDSVGVALLPALENMMGAATKLADIVLPPLVNFLENTLAPAVQTVSGVINDFFMLLQGGDSPLEALRGALEMAFGEEVAGRIMAVVDGIVQFGEKVAEFLEPILTWIGENVQLQDVLLALGIAIASVVVPALISIVTAAAPIIAAAVALIAIIVLVRKAWESDFLGIRTFVMNTLAQIQAWWAEHGAQVIATVQAMWTWIVTTVTTIFTAVKEFIAAALEAIREWWQVHGDDVMTIVNAFMTAIRTTIETIINVVSGIVNTVLSAIRTFWDEHGQAIMRLAKNAWDNIKATVDTIIHTVQEIIGAVAAAIRGDWEDFGEHLRSAWEGLWEGIKRILRNAKDSIGVIIRELIDRVIKFFTETDWGAIGQGIIEGIINGIKKATKWMIDTVVAAAQAAVDAVAKALGFGSPSKVFMGMGEGMMEGLALGVKRMAALPQVELNAALQPMVDVSQVGAAEPVTRETNIYVEPHYYRGDEPSLGEELRVLRLAYGL